MSQMYYGDLLASKARNCNYVNITVIMSWLLVLLPTAYLRQKVITYNYVRDIITVMCT